MVASFLVGVLLARGLGVEGYGYYSLALAVITIAALPAEMGLPFLVTREVAGAAARNDLPRLFGVLRWADKASLWISGTVAAAILAGAVILYYAGSAVVAAALVLGAPVVPLVALAKVRGGALQGLDHVVRGQIPWVLLRPLVLGLLLLGILAAGVRFSAPVAMALTSVSAAVVFAVAWAWLKQRLPGEVPAEVVHSGRRWLASTIPMGLMEGMRILQPEAAVLIVGLLAAPEAVGLFRIAVVTAAIAAAPIAMIVHAALPVMARLHQEQRKDQLQKAVTGVAHAQFAGVLLLSLPLLLVPGPLVSLAFGESFVPASDALRMLAVAQIVNAAFGPNIWLLNMSHHEGRVAKAMGIALAATLVTVPLFALAWGIVGAAAALLVSMLCWNVIAWFDARRLLGIETSIVHWPWRQEPRC